MLVNGIKFPEIKTEYDYYNFKINNRTIKLVYRIRQYRLVTEETLVKNLRKNKVKLKYEKRMNNLNEVVGAYYIPYDSKTLALGYKVRLIAKMLGIKVTDTQTMLQHILDKWEDKGVNKNTQQPLMDKEAIALDILGSYYLGGYEGKLVLTQQKEKRIAEMENTSLSAMLEDQEKSNKEAEKKTKKVGTMSKLKFKKVQRKRKPASKSNKLFNLYSYNNHKDEKTWDCWFDGTTWSADQDFHYKFDRLINPDLPYKAKWCIVDTDNAFEFCGKVYEINKSVKQYAVGRDNQCDMEKILVMEQFGNMYFYDEEINVIEEKNITLV